MESNYEKTKQRVQREFAGRDLSGAAARFGMEERGGVYSFVFLGSACRIDSRTGLVECADVCTGQFREADFDEAMTVYDLLGDSDPDAAPSGIFASMESLPRQLSAEFRSDAGSFYQKDSKAFDGKTERLRAALAQLRGMFLDEDDVSAVLDAFCGLRVKFRFWNSDEEFGPQIRFYWDSNVLSYMRYETVWYANAALIRRIARLFDAARIHGGGRDAFARRYGKEPLDFSANISPLGMPEEVRAAVISSMEDAVSYPDPSCLALREAIAEKLRSDGYAADADRLLIGNGAAGLIDRLARALPAERVLVTAPTFGEYRTAYLKAGAEVAEYPLSEKDGFRIGAGLIDHLKRKRPDALILCEPNNPTGIATEPGLLSRIAETCAELGIWLVVDECFNGFLDDPAAHTLMGRIFPRADAAFSGAVEKKSEKLLILRAFTKFYGMAGLRLGWCACTDPALLARMRDAGQPWEVSVPAQRAGTAALSAAVYAEKLRALIREERKFLQDELGAIGLKVIPGEANYLLFYDPEPGLSEALSERGILIRGCADYSGLKPGWYRTAVRTREENRRLIEAVRQIHGDR